MTHDRTTGRFRLRPTRPITGVALAALLALTACGVARDDTDEHEMTALMRASRSGDAAEVRRLAADGARINQAVKGHSRARVMLAFLAWMQDLPDRDPGYRALHYAADGGHGEAARALLEAGAEPGAAAAAGETPLWIAARRGDSAMARLLMDAGAPVRRPRDAGGAWLPPVAAAVFARHEGLVRMLLDAGAEADPDSGHFALSPLATAAASGDSGIAALLLQRGAAPDRASREGQTALMLAARDGHLAIVRLLLAAGADASRRDERAGWTAAQWAASGEHDSVVRAIEQSAPAAAGTDDVELVRAVRTRDSTLVRQLLARGANPNARMETGQPVLSAAIARQDVAIARALLEARASWRLRGPGDIPYLHAAAQRGNLELARLLLDAGAPAATAGTAIHAASSGRLDVLELVHRAGANVRESDDEPLRAAAIAGGVESVRWLLARGAQVDARDSNGRTALSRAVAFRQHGTVRVLLDGGADPRQRAPDSGWTPLMHAAIGGDSAMIVMLMAAGADPEARDSEGKTAAEIARRAGQAHVIALLR